MMYEPKNTLVVGDRQSSPNEWGSKYRLVRCFYENGNTEYVIERHDKDSLGAPYWRRACSVVPLDDDDALYELFDSDISSKADPAIVLWLIQMIEAKANDESWEKDNNEKLQAKIRDLESKIDTNDGWGQQ
jgi:hypothetical protein